MHACTAALCTGVQIYLVGCGAAMSLSLSGAWIASLAALPAAVLIALRCRALHARGGFSSRISCLLLSAVLLFCAVYALGATAAFTGQTLLDQAHTAWSTALGVLFAALCALSGEKGVSRLSFSCRFVLPGLLIALIALALPGNTPDGLFPLLGTGGTPLLAAALCMLCGAVPALMLLLPPPGLEGGSAAQQDTPPDTRFFLVRVLAGAGAGAAFLFLACICTTYESIAERSDWGIRLFLLAAHQPHRGILQMALTLLQLCAMALLAGNMLCAAHRALALARRKKKQNRALLVPLVLLLLAGALAFTALGDTWLLWSAPLLAIPAALLLILPGKGAKP